MNFQTLLHPSVGQRLLRLPLPSLTNRKWRMFLSLRALPLLVYHQPAIHFTLSKKNHFQELSWPAEVMFLRCFISYQKWTILSKVQIVHKHITD